MQALEPCCTISLSQEECCLLSTLLYSDSNLSSFALGGLFLDPTIPSSFVRFISSTTSTAIGSNSVSSSLSRRKANFLGGLRRRRENTLRVGNGLLSVSLRSQGFVGEPKVDFEKNGGEGSDKTETCDGGDVVLEGRKKKRQKFGKMGGGAVNTSKHFWAGAIAAMVSRTCVAPLERLKLEYILRGEKKNLIELIHKIATTQGLGGFWKGNFLNILRTAPFKAVNFCAYETYRRQLLRLTGNDETANFERFIAGAAAGVTATVLCLPLDTIRTKMVAPGGEAFGGVIGAFSHMIQTEGFFSLYKGLVPSILSMAPSSAVFYSVYDILKSAFLHSPEGRRRIQRMNRHGQELNALDQLELGPIRTLLYGAVAGVCAEAATYPFEVVRRQLQMQVQATRLSAIATCAKIIEQRGIPALYTGLIPSLLQVLPSAAISYFVYEFMKVVLKVD